MIPKVIKNAFSYLKIWNHYTKMIRKVIILFKSPKIVKNNSAIFWAPNLKSFHGFLYHFAQGKWEFLDVSTMKQTTPW